MSTTFDSYAWIEYFAGTKKGERVRLTIDSSEQIFTPSICLMEIKSKYLRENKPCKEQIEFILSRSVVTDITKEIALSAAELKQAEDLYAIDALVYAATKANKTKLLTGDKHFQGKKDVEFLE